MSAPVYSDLGKKAKDLLKKGYYTENPVQVEVTAKTANNVKLHGLTASDRKDGSLSVLLEPGFQHKGHNYELGASISSDAKKGHTFKGSWEPNSVKGLKTTLGLTTLSKKTEGKPQDKIFSTLGLEYKAYNYTGTALLNFPFVASKIKDRQPIMTVTGTYRYGNLTFGGLVEEKLPIETEPFQISKWATSFDYSRDDSSVTLSVNSEVVDDDDDKLVATLGFYQRVHTDLEIGSEISVASLLEPAKIQFGGIWGIDTGSTIRAKVDSEGQVGLSLQHKLNSTVTLTASADVNAVTAVGHKYGFHFNFLF
eukprot:TRINITY_DN326_c0_g4_i1.p1 TRINITY_DN326_c0_g4~~TRINITY_DN326_c0_g4_i1.p1  ORF type:complete len:309 (-),score=64.09 TRINITY_DN326_c0_g4_i1:144-1070(-)